MAGAPCTIPRHATRRSASMWRTFETLGLRIGDRVDFTFYWPEADRWEGIDFVVCVE